MLHADSCLRGDVAMLGSINTLLSGVFCRDDGVAILLLVVKTTGVGVAIGVVFRTKLFFGERGVLRQAFSSPSLPIRASPGIDNALPARSSAYWLDTLSYIDAACARLRCV